jgi:hypothetical protein
MEVCAEVETKDAAGSKMARTEASVGELEHLELKDVDSTSKRIPAAVVKLSADERKLLSDPDWVDEDEVDLIAALRVERGQARLAIPFEEYLSNRGRRAVGIIAV